MSRNGECCPQNHSTPKFYSIDKNWKYLKLGAMSMLPTNSSASYSCKVLTRRDWPFLRSPLVVLSGTGDLKYRKVKPPLSPVVNFNSVLQINIEVVH